MYFFVFILLYKFQTIITEDVLDNEVFQVQVSDVADLFISLLRNKIKDTDRIKDLKEKLAKIDTYVVDRDKYLNRITLEAQLNQLNATNFYDALSGKDAFQNWRNESKSLYLKLKEKMNRDDLLSILSDRGKKKYARRMMSDGYRPSKQKEMALDEAVDKFLGEKAFDNHQFGEETQSKYWDPEGEIQERLRKRSGRRIFKGERSTIRNYPFVVSIHIMGRFWCGGAIYWADLVITSASCLQLMHNNRFFRENPKALQVRVGSNHSRVGGEVVDALEVFFHPGYNPRTLTNNIAIIRLRDMLKFSYHRIPKMIEISTQGLGVPFTATVLLLGWGVTKTNQKLAYEPIFLQTKQLPIYPNKFCQDVYGKKFVTQTMFCAGTLTTGEGACDHDAGGPAVLSGKLVGIISFGPSICGFHDAPTVFTLVGAYTDWIETVNETFPGHYRGVKRTSTTRMDLIHDYFSHTTYSYTAEEHWSPSKTFAPPHTYVPPQTYATEGGYVPAHTYAPTYHQLAFTDPTSPPFTPSFDGDDEELLKGRSATKNPIKRSEDIDLDFELPSAKSRDRKRESFRINPVGESEDQVGMFVESRRKNKHLGVKGRGKKKERVLSNK